MKAVYDEIIDFVVCSGKRIARRAGRIDDIGVKKRYLTEEDIAIERGLREIIKRHHPDHELFSEEEHYDFPETDDVWVADPISGTKTFIEGLPHYGICVAHTRKGEILFGAVYDPSADELFTAFRGGGAFLNGKSISVSAPKGIPRVLLIVTHVWTDQDGVNTLMERLSGFEMFRNWNSTGVNFCHVACGRYDGAVCLNKDTFSTFAPALIVQEAGGLLTNVKGGPVRHQDRFFVCGSKGMHGKLMGLVKNVRLKDPCIEKEP